MALTRSEAWPLPSGIFSRCSATDRGTPVMSAGRHANISKFSFRSEHSSVHPLADNVLNKRLFEYVMPYSCIKRTCLKDPTQGMKTPLILS
ncbi:hypothetical protein Tco_0177500 [Tanacetum coccineum]